MEVSTLLGLCYSHLRRVWLDWMRAVEVAQRRRPDPARLDEVHVLPPQHLLIRSACPHNPRLITAHGGAGQVDGRAVEFCARVIGKPVPAATAAEGDVQSAERVCFQICVHVEGPRFGSRQSLGILALRPISHASRGKLDKCSAGPTLIRSEGPTCLARASNDFCGGWGVRRFRRFPGA